MRIRAFFRASVLVFAMLTVSAKAAEHPPLSDSLSGEAKTLYDVGRILYRDGDYSGALGKFRRAHELSHDARLLWNMAGCEKNLRHYTRVLPLVDRYLTEGGDRLTTDDREKAKAFAAAIRAFVGELTIRADGDDTVSAAIAIDDEEAGTVPAEALLVDQGKRRIRVTKQGFRGLEQSIDVEGGGRHELRVRLEREAGQLTVRAREADAIVVDDRPVGRGTWTGTLPAGRHVVAVSASGRRGRKTEVRIADRETKDLALETEPQGLPVWPFWLGGGALAAGALAVGGYFVLRPEEPAPVSGSLGLYQVP